MPLKIIWSPTAKKSFDNLVNFLEQKWEKKVIVKLFSELNECLDLISNNPELFPVFSKKKNLRKCVIRRKTLLLYKIKSKDKIELVLLVDTRQNLKKYRF